MMNYFFLILIVRLCYVLKDSFILSNQNVSVQIQARTNHILGLPSTCIKLIQRFHNKCLADLLHLLINNQNVSTSIHGKISSTSRTRGGPRAV